MNGLTMASPLRPQLSIAAPNADALFDGTTPPAFPHSGRLVNPKLALYLEGLAREQRHAPALDLEVTLHSPALPASAEEEVRRALRTYFEEERVSADLDVRVNRVEGLGSLRFGLPLIVLALAVAGVFYVTLPELTRTSFVTYLTALLYLVFITIVWVMLWDPIETLLFDSFLLRARRTALEKLRDATVRFAYSAVG